MDESRRDRTLWCGGLEPKVTEELLRELFVQAGPVEDVKIPKDNNGRTKNFAFVTFVHPESVGYTLALMDGISLYGRRIRLERRPHAAVDDTYVNMMKTYYDYMDSVRASANTFNHPVGMGSSSCTLQPQRPPRVLMPMDGPMSFASDRSFGPECVPFHREYSRCAQAYPPANESKQYDRYYGQDRYDRQDRQGRPPGLYTRFREFRSDKNDTDMHSKYRGQNGYDRRYEEPRHRRLEDRGDYLTKRRRY
ncbi:uncharacterized protein LOC142566098 [Dermacentor variabilis]|uniref:uncharacterized protein LOC142566098 n=1 Tax=Dermacentor variabilis TaxID=34621 RepID=UPI003F5CA212